MEQYNTHLTLGKSANKKLLIGDDITVTVLSNEKGSTLIYVKTPPSIRIKATTARDSIDAHIPASTRFIFNIMHKIECTLLKRFRFEHQQKEWL